MEQQSQPAPSKLMQYITGHWVAAAVSCMAKLALADHLTEGPKTSEELADIVNAHGPSVYRLMRALSRLEIVQEVAPHTFELTDVGQYLRTDHPQSIRSMALFQGSSPHWRSWGSFLYSVQTGKSAFEHVHGQSFFDYCQTDDEFAAAFNGAMTGMSRQAAEAIVEAYDFSTINKLVDVGGGHGHLLATILRKYPLMQGVVFDLPGVVSGAHATINDAELNGRCEAIGGSFFESVPAGDAYIAKHIIHDWDDEHSLRILRNMREAAIGRPRALLVEVVVDTATPEPFAALMDLEMLQATHGGRERTAAEFSALFAGAGWQLERIIPTKSLVSVLEAFAR